MPDELKEKQPGLIVDEAPHVVPGEEVASPSLPTTVARSGKKIPLDPALANATTSALAVTFAINLSVVVSNIFLFCFCFWYWIFAAPTVGAQAHEGIRTMWLAGPEGCWLWIKFAYLACITTPLPIGLVLFGGVLLTLGFTGLHLFGNKRFVYLRWPWLALMIPTSLAWFPVLSCAYGISWGVIDTVLSGGLLGVRLLDWLLPKIAGPVHPQLKRADRMRAAGIVAVLACLPFVIWTLVSIPIVGLLASAFAVNQALHIYWHRRITQCLKNDSEIYWEEVPIRTPPKAYQPCIILGSGWKTEGFLVRWEEDVMPDELHDLMHAAPRTVQLGFDRRSHRPVAVKMRGRTFPLTTICVRLP